MDYVDAIRLTAIECAKRLSRKRGQQFGWRYDVTARYDEALANALANINEPNFTQFRLVYAAAHASVYRRFFDPFPRCSSVCGAPEDKSGACLYRFSIEDSLGRDRNQVVETFRNLGQSARDSQPDEMESRLGRARARVTFCTEKAQILAQNATEGEPPQRIALCFAQQLMSDDPLGSEKALDDMREILTSGVLS
jgi:hypothetical protein